MKKRKNQPVKAIPAPGPEQHKEIATIWKDITRFVYGGSFLSNIDPTLVSRGGATQLDIYDDIERDCHAFAVLQKRKLAVISREWTVEAGGDRPIDKDAAELVEEQLKGMSFDLVCLDQLDAILKGFAVGEVIWETVGNVEVAKKILARNQRRFVFDPESQLRLRTWQSMYTGDELPEKKFVVFQWGSKKNDPYGLGLGTRLFWPVFFKKQGIQFWLTFADKFGSPTAIGKYPPGTPVPEQDKLMNALTAIAQEAGVIIPEDMAVDFMQAKLAGTTTTYEDLCRYMDEQISEAVLGETGSTNQSGGGGSRSRDEVGNECRLEIAQADSIMQCGVINSTVVQWIVDYNLPGAAYPRVSRNFEEPINLLQKAQTDKLIVDMGYEPVEPSYFDETYGGKWQRRVQSPAPVAMQPQALPPIPSDEPGGQNPDTPAVMPPSNQPIAKVDSGLQGPAFAAGTGLSVEHDRAKNASDQQMIADGAETLAAQYKKLLGKRFEELLAIFEETKNFKLVQKKLAELLTAPPPKELVDAIAKARFAARVMGRAAPAKP